jgi:Phosphodiester glycosidase
MSVTALLSIAAATSHRTIVRLTLTAIACFSVIAATPSFANESIKPSALLDKLAWQPLYRGIEHATATLHEPRRMALHILRIDTQAEGVAFFSTPGSPKPRSAGEETLGVRTTSFLLQHKLQAAINAAPYGPQYEMEGMPYNVAGLHIHDGELISRQTKTYPALLIDRDNRARIAMPPFSIANARTAVGGFNIVLKNGESATQNEGGIHPRTAVGISVDRRIMWWLVIDGRQPGYSDGATLIDLARIFRELGASDAINLDGGGTSTMVIEHETKRSRTLNRPIHNGIIGMERVAGSHLGVFAQSLTK